MFAILTALALLQLPSNLDKACELSLRGDYEASNAILIKMNPEISDSVRYAFYRGTNSFVLNNKEDAKKWLTFVVDSFEEVPSRYKNLSSAMLDNLKEWKTGDMADISRDMRVSGDRLQVAKGGSQTQVIQKEIVSKLDKLIKELEDKSKAKPDEGEGEGDGHGIPVPGQSQGNGKPAEDSRIADNSGKGLIDEKKLRKYADNWGKLPEKERVKIVQDITRDLPAKYKPMIEDYFKALSRNAGIPKK